MKTLFLFLFSISANACENHFVIGELVKINGCVDLSEESEICYARGPVRSIGHHGTYEIYIPKINRVMRVAENDLVRMEIR